MKPAKLLFILGTRPEAIKLAPLIMEFKNRGGFLVNVCVIAQHRELLDQVLSFFEIHPDYDLDIMKKDQSLFDIFSSGLKGLESVLEKTNPQFVFVQGDTTSSFAGAFAAYLKKIKVIHIEAGLRSGNKYSPFPEEMNRLLTSRIADIHFTPTNTAYGNLENENIKRNIFTVGNTAIDALLLGLELLKQRNENEFLSLFNKIDFNKRIVLITGHRRESFGIPFENICAAIKILAEKYPDAEFVYPIHLNPNVQQPVRIILSGISNVHLLNPLGYPQFVWLMNKSNIILTDSGGIQEEAPSLGKPVLVMRNITERQEGIDAGLAKLTGTDKNKIIAETSNLLDNKNEYEKMISLKNPYGDGTACRQIADIVTGMILNE